MAEPLRQLVMPGAEETQARRAGRLLRLDQVRPPESGSIAEAMYQPRIACLLVPHFILEVELLTRPELRGQPVVVAAAPGDRQIVLDCSEEAAVYGVRPGAQLRHAMARCHQAAFIEGHPTQYADLNMVIFQALFAHSPRVDVAGQGRFFVDLGGLDGEEPFLLARLITAAQDSSKLNVRAAIGSGKFAAYAAASAAQDGPLIVPPAGVMDFVANLPASALPVAYDIHRRLELLGLRTLGRIAKLRRSSLQAQFGPEGRRIWALSHGLDPTPFSPVLPREELVERLTFEEPAATIEALISGVQVLLSRLTERLQREARSCRGLRLRAGLANRRTWEKQVNFREPTSDPRRMAAVVRQALERQAWTSSVEELELMLWEVAPRSGTQPDLFVERRGAAERIDSALLHLEARYRPLPVYRIIQPDPESRLPERRYGLTSYRPDATAAQIRTLRPATSIAVETDDEGAPRRIMWRDFWVDVAVLRREFRIRDEWWSKLVARRYFKLVLSGGQFITVYQDGGQWYRG